MRTLFISIILGIIVSFFSGCKKDIDVVIKKEKVSGFAQKGPYINGTQILMSELNTQLQQTGNVFSTQIINNQGSFELNDLTLESQFVEFSASGFYFDEVKGELSSAPLTLYALSDIKDISTVNVNILTHLEKRRVEHLVKNDGKSFSDAKKIAQSEVLAIFGFSNDDMGNSESLEITGDHERNGILLAISVILQGERSVGELTELLAAISDDISTNGLLNNENIIPALEASTRELNLELIKKNLEGRYNSLGLGVTIPDLEKPIYIFLNRCWPPPTNAEAGTGQYFNDGTTSTTLAANTPVEGTGKWSIISGEGGSFDDDTKPDAVFTGQINSTYTLQWKISTQCNTSEDLVTIGFTEPITDIDGNIYKTVWIGDQMWMAENLKVTKDSQGNPITRYCYDNNSEYCNWYGGLYDWETVMNGAASSGINPSGVQGICPTGWHVPSDDEWTQLVDFVVALGYPNSSVAGAGNALKSCRQVNSPLGGECSTSVHPRWEEDNWSGNNHHGTDIFSFSALPGGDRHTDGYYLYIGCYGSWWSSSENSSASAWRRGMLSYFGYVGRYYGGKRGGFSVRCVRD